MSLVSRINYTSPAGTCPCRPVQLLHLWTRKAQAKEGKRVILLPTTHKDRVDSFHVFFSITWKALLRPMHTSSKVWWGQTTKHSGVYEWWLGLHLSHNSLFVQSWRKRIFIRKLFLVLKNLISILMNGPIYSSTKMTSPWQKECMSPNKEADSRRSLSPAQPGWQGKWATDS